MQSTKSIHIPLPVIWHEKLRELSETLHVSATELARNAIIELIKEQEKKKLSDEIAKFAQEYGNTEFDLDKELENAGLEYLQNQSL